VIEKISRGFQIGGLIRYLMGPGRFNEHTDQRVVAMGVDLPEMHQVPTFSDGTFDATDLVERLVEPARSGGVSLSKPVVERGGKTPQVRYDTARCGITPPTGCSRDTEWAEVVADGTGIAPRGMINGRAGGSPSATPMTTCTLPRCWCAKTPVRASTPTATGRIPGRSARWPEAPGHHQH
jgi:hypothetical protein